MPRPSPILPLLFLGLSLTLPTTLRANPDEQKTPAPSTWPPLDPIPTETPDYATLLAALVEAREAGPDGARADRPNKWGELIALTSEVRGAWGLYRALHPGLPDDPAPTTDPAALRPFFTALDAAGISDRAALLADDARFVAPRTTDLLIETGFPELGPVRLAVRLWLARLHLALADADARRARAILDQALAVRRGAASRGVLIDHLAALGIQESIDAALAAEARAGALHGPVAASLLAALKAAPLPDLRAAFEGERLFAKQATDHDWTDETAAARKRMEAGQPPEPGWRPLAPRANHLAAVDRFFDAALVLLPGEGHDPAAADRAMDAVLAAARAPEGPRLRPLGINPQAVRNALARQQQVERGHAIALLTLALEAHRARTGGYPAALASLVPDELSTIPDGFTYAPTADAYELAPPTPDSTP